MKNRGNGGGGGGRAGKRSGPIKEGWLSGPATASGASGPTKAPPPASRSTGGRTTSSECHDSAKLWSNAAGDVLEGVEIRGEGGTDDR